LNILNDKIPKFIIDMINVKVCKMKDKFEYKNISGICQVDGINKQQIEQLKDSIKQHAHLKNRIYK
jgi:hypothetical protein